MAKNFNAGGILLAAFIKDQIAGYVFAYERQPKTKNIHCWMAGVKKEFRRRGVLKKLMAQLTKVARKKGYKRLTINTYPKRFPHMFNFLTTHGYNLYKKETKEWRGWPSQIVTKTFFRQDID